MGAVGTLAVCDDLGRRGHQIVELERGSLEAKIWKGEKRRRVRIPDLICKNCGCRIEVRAKGQQVLSLSHSPKTEERCWDFGMVGSDIIAFPICVETGSPQNILSHYTNGTLIGGRTEWIEREWSNWIRRGAINYFTVSSFRDTPYDSEKKKGAGDGSETSLTWKACFAPHTGEITKLTKAMISVTSADGVVVSRKHAKLNLFFTHGQSVEENQVLASKVKPCSHRKLQCKGSLTTQKINKMLRSRSMPVRFGGIKLARLRNETGVRVNVERISNDAHEDIYVRLEAKTYLAKVHSHSVAELFNGDLRAEEGRDRLEAIIAIGEINNDESIKLLSDTLLNAGEEYFIRSAAAYCLGRSCSETARIALISSFDDISHRIREDALISLVMNGPEAIPGLIQHLAHDKINIQAGCAEALRRMAPAIPNDSFREQLIGPVIKLVNSDPTLHFAAWLLGQLWNTRPGGCPPGTFDGMPEVTYLLAVSRAFASSWLEPIHLSNRQPME